MTTAHLVGPISVRTVLFGSQQQALDVLREVITSGDAGSVISEALAELSHVTRAAAVGEFSRVASGLLDLDLTDILTMAWQKHTAITAAARRTTDAPGAEELVELVTHTISWVHRPYVELLVDDLKVATVHFELKLDFEVKCLVVAIRAGRITAIHSGDCSMTAALAAEGAKIAERQTELDLPLVIRLGNGLPMRTMQPSRPLPILDSQT
jgi:hypothetical protein